ncbi:HAD family phosphatase [uncultured Aeromicrobium sp.]|uniref:HAD family hydrolase n=1 Tax=uncultured Aeromicrobium sp. TaxID=337820 RepID=UPI0025F470D7|nr:HAD family phosphatase [uncultured Aeromicrobium sp.]
MRPVRPVRLLLGETGETRLEIAAVVVDCDGLLVDSESVWMGMLRQWLAENGADQQQADEFLGLSAYDAARRLLGTGDANQPNSVGRTEICELESALSRRYSVLLTQAVRPMPGAYELIASLYGRVPIAVASNGRRDDVTRLLESAGILAMVDAVCTIEDVTRGKPAPDVYEIAVRSLGVEASGAVAFEDSPHGARAARAAGLTVVGVNPDPGIELAAHHRLTGLDQVVVGTTETSTSGGNR